MLYSIRPAQRSDADALAGLLRSIGYFERLSVEPLEATQERVARHLALCLADDSHSVYVAVGEEAHLVGYLSVHWLPYLFQRGPEGYISELFVAEAARGQGIGAALLDTAVAEARRRGCGRMMLLNMRQRESYRRGFYASHGWEERPEAANFVLVLE